MPQYSGGELSLAITPVRWEVNLQRYDGSTLLPITKIVKRGHLFVSLNGLGSFSLELSPKKLNALGYKDIALDSMLEFRRKHGAVRTFSFFKRKTDRTRDTLTISGYGLNHLLKRRAIPYYAESSYAKKNMALDDMAKELVRENCTSDAKVFDDTATTDTLRDYAALGFSLTVQPNNTAAPVDTMGFAWEKDLFATLQKVCQNSTQQGTRLFFNVERIGDTAFEFRTYIDQQGTDRRAIQTFGAAAGNLTETKVVLDRSEEVTYLYVAGRGDAANRKIEEVSNTTRLGASPINRLESVYNATSTADADLAGVGNSVLEKYKPVRLFDGELVSRFGAYYGIDWELGDLLDIDDGGEQFTALVHAVEFDFAPGGKTTARGRFTILDE